MRISTTINLAAFKGASVRPFKSKSGDMVDCLVIPIAMNRMVKDEYGVKIDTIGFPLKEKKGNSKSTHLVKQSLRKEEYEKLTKEEQEALPLLGNHVLWEDNGGGEIGASKVIEQAEDDPIDDSEVPF